MRISISKFEIRKALARGVLPSLSCGTLPLFSPRCANQRRPGKADFIVSRRSLSEAANVSFRAVLGPSSRAHHLGEQIDVIVRFARHGLANLMQHGQELGPAVHIVALDLGFLV